MKTSKKPSTKKPEKAPRPRKPKATPPKALVYDLRPGGQPGHQLSDQIATVVNFSTWRCDGKESPVPTQNAGSVTFELTDNLATVKTKIIDAVAAMYDVEKDDVVLLA